MALNTATQKADLRAVMTDLGSTITVGETDYTAIVGDDQEGRETGVAAFLTQNRLRVMILQSDFDTLPVLGDVLTYDGDVYRVDEIQADPDSIHLILMCEQNSS